MGQAGSWVGAPGAFVRLSGGARMAIDVEHRFVLGSDPSFFEDNAP